MPVEARQCSFCRGNGTKPGHNTHPTSLSVCLSPHHILYLDCLFKFTWFHCYHEMYFNISLALSANHSPCLRTHLARLSALTHCDSVKGFWAKTLQRNADLSRALLTAPFFGHCYEFPYPRLRLTSVGEDGSAHYMLRAFIIVWPWPGDSPAELCGFLIDLGLPSQWEPRFPTMRAWGR